MRRADRLFQIVQHLRGGRLLTAAKLADRLEVSERTIYRDIADLQASGVPVEGEAGVGYLMQSGFDLPPLMFTRDEIVALVVGARLLRAWGGAEMSRAAVEALVKIDAVLPDQLRGRADAVPVHAFAPQMTVALSERLDRIEKAAEARDVLLLAYFDKDGEASDREIWPLGLLYWGSTWTIAAWCELRNDFRMFRLDRIDAMTVTDRRFPVQKGRTLEDFYRLVSSCEERPLPRFAGR